MRSAPADGYDFGNKRQYRRNIYRKVRDSFGGHLSEKTCAIMPSIEGDEIDVAMHYGFRQSNICIIDRNSAIVATLKRRYPLVRTYGVSAADAARRIVNDIGPVDFVNLDLCGPIGDSTRETLSAWSEAGAFQDSSKNSGVVALTVLRGRERDGLVANLNAETFKPKWWGVRRARILRPDEHTDRFRLVWMAKAIEGLDFAKQRRGEMLTDEWFRARYTAFAIAWGKYRSAAGSQTMLWGYFKVHSRACLCDECLPAFASEFSWWKDLQPLDAIKAKAVNLKRAGWTNGDIKAACGVDVAWA